MIIAAAAAEQPMYLILRVDVQRYSTAGVHIFRGSSLKSHSTQKPEKTLFTHLKKWQQIFLIAKKPLTWVCNFTCERTAAAVVCVDNEANVSFSAGLPDQD